MLPATSADAIVRRFGVHGERFRREAWALGHFDGDGAARLLDQHLPDGALLLERVRPGVTIDALRDAEMVVAGCAVIERLQRPSRSSASPLVSAAVARPADIAAWAADIALAPDAAAIEDAHRTVAQDATPTVICHGDLNPGNILASDVRGPWLAIDPLPVSAPPAYDAVSLIWSRRAWLLEQDDAAAVLADRVAIVSKTLCIPAAALRAWTVVRATALLIERRTWGGYDAESFVAVIGLLAGSR